MSRISKHLNKANNQSYHKESLRKCVIKTNVTQLYHSREFSFMFFKNRNLSGCLISLCIKHLNPCYLKQHNFNELNAHLHHLKSSTFCDC